MHDPILTSMLFHKSLLLSALAILRDRWKYPSQTSANGPPMAHSQGELLSSWTSITKKRLVGKISRIVREYRDPKGWKYKGELAIERIAKID